MGMAAAQAKLLSLTARRSDINYQLSSLMRGKLDLMTQASNAADALSAAQRNNNIFVMTTSDNQQTQLSFNSLSKEGLTIVDAKGRTIVPSSYRGNVKGLANVLPASHPAVKSYDGDFVPKTKLTKNYVSIPENTIPMFAETDPENREQKTVKAAQGEPTVQTKYKEQDTIYTNLSSAANIATVEDLYDYLNKYKDHTMIIGKKGNSDNWFNKDTLEINEGCAQSFTFGKNSKGDFETTFDKAFASEVGYNATINALNNSLGCDGYTAYSARQFQYKTSYTATMSKMKQFDAEWNKNITYVSNAEQFITALLKSATITNGTTLQSNAKIMLLNDIDLDDMLQDDNGKGGLKEFIQNEISSLELDSTDNNQKTNYNNAMNKFYDIANATYDNNSWENNKTNIFNMFENLAKAYGINTSNLSGSNIIEQINSISDNDTAGWSSVQKQFRKKAQDLHTLFEVIEQDNKKKDIELSNGTKLTKDECSNWSKLSSEITAASAAAVGGTKSKSGIDASVIANVYSKYFSGGRNDKFNEDFTNFIQIDNFTGAIGGGGFAINNLKMDATKGQFAGMFCGVTNALLDGIWMDNAQVLSSENGGRDPNKQNAAILAHNVNGETFINVSAKGQQFTINERQGYNGNNFKTENFLGMAKDGCKLTEKKSTKQPLWSHSRSDYVNAGWSIVNNDKRMNDYIKKTYEHEYKIGLDRGYVNTGYSFDSYNTYAGGDYSTKHEGWRSVAMDTDRGNGGGEGSNQRLISSSSGNNVGDGFSAFDVRYEQNLWKICVTQKDVVNNTVGANVINVIFQNAAQHNSKIKIYSKEDVKKYTEPDNTWKNGAKFDDGTVVDWQDWEVVDGFNSETGEYTLVKKHGEETEEYLQIKDLLEFYKEQNVRVEYDENRETGYFTYSASGYSIDVEYKEDLNKYLSDNYLYKVENNDSSIVVYERDKVVDIDSSQLVFVDDIEAVLDKNIKNGVWFVQGASVSDASKYERKSLDEIGISETTDEKADAVAQAEYDRKIREIEIQEEKYDAQITELESTLKGIEQEIENQEKIVKQNIQSSFSTFSS